MKISLINSYISFQDFSPIDIEESLDDPFAIKIIPPDDAPQEQDRYYLLGKSSRGKLLFLVFTTDAKEVRIMAARHGSDAEETFYRLQINI